VAVYKRTYEGYNGLLTPTWSRFLIVARHSYSRLFQSKFLTIFMAVCLFYPLGCVAFIYLSNNSVVVSTLRLQNLAAIDEKFFYTYCNVQAVFAYILTAFISPSLVSWDLANGALPLYFCRPFSRVEYIVGKLAVLLPLLSLVTWIPGLILYIIQGSLTNWAWLQDNFWIARAIFVGLFIWIALLSLIGLALAACVKWRVAAGGLIFAVFFLGPGFGGAINRVMRVNAGSLIDLNEVMRTIWASLLRYDSGTEMTVGSAWVVLTLAAAICLGLLNKRIRTFEVVK
jgi:ABC-2 type transport system permease protein